MDYDRLPYLIARPPYRPATPLFTSWGRISWRNLKKTASGTRVQKRWLQSRFLLKCTHKLWKRHHRCPASLGIWKPSTHWYQLTHARTPEKTNLRSLWTASSVQPELESALMHSLTWQAHRKYGARTGTTPRSQRIMKNWSKLLKNIFDSFFVQF